MTRDRLSRAMLAASVLLFVFGFVQPLNAAEEAGDPMCAEIPIGAAEVTVNGAVTSFEWPGDGVSWSAPSARPHHFRVHVRTGTSMEVVWGNEGSWSGADLRSVTACHCPEPEPSTSTTTKATTTTTTTQPTTTSSSTTTSSTTTSSTSTTTTTTAEPTAPTSSATTAPSVPPTSIDVSPQVSQPPVQVLPQQVTQPDVLPQTGISTGQLAALAALLLSVGGVLVRGSALSES